MHKFHDLLGFPDLIRKLQAVHNAATCLYFWRTHHVVRCNACLTTVDELAPHQPTSYKLKITGVIDVHWAVQYYTHAHKHTNHIKSAFNGMLRPKDCIIEIQLLLYSALRAGFRLPSTPPCPLLCQLLEL